MRIRLRVPTDDEVKSSGLRGWFQRLRESFSGQAAPPDPKPRCVLKRDIVRRWSVRGDAKYFFEGRHCKNTGGAWHSEYVFTVFSAGELQQIRVVLPEASITAWEKEHDQRMSEDHRLRLARETMEELVDLRRFPSTITVGAQTIASAPLS